MRAGLTETFVIEDEIYKLLKNENTSLRDELAEIKEQLAQLNGLQEVMKDPKVRGAMEKVSRNE